MATVSRSVKQEIAPSDRALQELFVLQERIALTIIVQQQALHSGRGATSSAFVYKRLAGLCKFRLERLEKERLALVETLATC